MNVLIVEPSRTIAYTLSTLFGKHGFETRVAQCGQEALEMLEEKSPQLLCFTFELGDMDGIDFFVCARARKLVHHQPGLLFSSTPGKSVINRALMAGVTECFSKRHLYQLEQFVEKFAASSQVGINGHMPAQQLTIKALHDEFAAYRKDSECAGRLFEHVIEQLKAENEHLKRFVFESGAKL